MTGHNEHVFASDIRPSASKDKSADAALPQKGRVSTWTLQDIELRERWLKGETPLDISQALNRSVSAIMTRAARLGLPRRFAPGRKLGQRNNMAATQTAVARSMPLPIETPVRATVAETATTPQTSQRVCLMCLSKFQSIGRQNRICPKCKTSPDYIAGGRIADTDFQV